jgi:histidinol dehydrogenase
MKKMINPPPQDWPKLLTRPVAQFENLRDTVLQVFEAIQKEGDKALLDYTLAYDRVALHQWALGKEAMAAAAGRISPDLKMAIETARRNIERFHAAQAEDKNVIETTPGVFCWRESRPIEKVGFYIPGGSAPLFSTVLMLGVPAQLAGCREVVLCTPPDAQGEVHPAILYAAGLVGIQTVYTIGGIQAIGALTFGTETVSGVHKIFGPGNQYVMAAKQMAQQYGVAIDMPAGPSEVLVIADRTCHPDFVAADLLSQAEHGPDSQVVLLTDQEAVVEAVMQAMEHQLQQLPRRDITAQALQHGLAVVLPDLDDCLAFSNAYAPEHLILAIEHPHDRVSAVQHAGSVFLGHYSCESAGDYASGTNHTLPTNGYARSYSGVSLDSFVKKITFQELTREGLVRLGPSIEHMAAAEELMAHKNAVTLRLKSNGKK